MCWRSLAQPEGTYLLTSSNGLELTIPRRLFVGLGPEGSLDPRVEDLPSRLPLLLASLLEEVVAGAGHLTGAHGEGTCCT